MLSVAVSWVKWLIGRYGPTPVERVSEMNTDGVVAVCADQEY